MTTITLTLTPYQHARLIDALTEEVRKWDKVKSEILRGQRQASLDGAELLYNDAMEVLNVSLKGWS